MARCPEVQVGSAACVSQSAREEELPRTSDSACGGAVPVSTRGGIAMNGRQGNSVRVLFRCVAALRLAWAAGLRVSRASTAVARAHELWPSRPVGSGAASAQRLAIAPLVVLAAAMGPATTQASTPRFCGTVGSIAVTVASGRVTCGAARRVVRRVRARPVGSSRAGSWRCTVFSQSAGSCRGASGRINWERNELG